MTAALNLGLLGNNVNTSGQVSLTTGVSGTLPVANGGIGTTTLTANNVLLGNGASAPQVVAPGTSGNVLQSNGATWVSSTLPAPSTTQVLSATAGASLGAVGTYAFLSRPAFSVTTSTAGTTYAGSSLRYAGAISQYSTGSGASISASAPAGTWRAMGYANSQYTCGAVWENGTLFLRIS